MSLAERLGQAAVVLVLAALLVWGAVRRAQRRHRYRARRYMP